MQLRSILTLAVLLLSLAPAASARDCTSVPSAASFCTDEDVWGDSCSERDTFDFGITQFVVSAPVGRVTVEGSEACWWFQEDEENDDRFRGQNLYVDIVTQAGTVNYAWNSFERSNSEGTTSECDSYVEVDAADVDDRHHLGCPAGNPPNPGWGRVLP